MKKIYYLMYLLPLMPLVSACEDDAEVVRLQNQSAPAVSVEGISPEYGYAGDRFTITGANFGSGVDFVRVFVGENEAEVLTCTDTQIQAVVPDDATSGWVSVQYMGQEVKSDLMYRVMGKPEVVAMSPLFGDGSDAVAWGFAGGELTFGGGELGGSESDIDVRFTGSAASAQVTSWSANAFTVQVPEDAQSGAVTLNVGSQREVNVPYAFRLVQHAEVSGITPARGYKGCEVTVNGSNLGDESTQGGTRVYFGDMAGTIVSCSGEAIVVTTPAGLEEGQEYAVRVVTPFETVGSMPVFTVAPSPAITEDDIPADAYVGEKITLKGTSLPAKEDMASVKVFFGETEAVISEEDYDVDEVGDGEFKVTVPNLPAGSVALQVEVAGVELLQGKAITINASPIVTSFDCPLVVSGGTLKILGTDLGTNTSDVTVNIGETPVTPTAATGTELTVTVPTYSANTRDVPVSLTYNFGNDRIVDIELEQTLNVIVPGDVTEFILRNYQQPFQGETGFTGDEWDTLLDWTRNSVFVDAGIGCLSYGNNDNRDTRGFIALHVWGRRNIHNGKLYQRASIPAGTYTITLSGVASGRSNGSVNGVFVVCEGTEESDIVGYNNGIYPDTDAKLLAKGVIAPDASETVTFTCSLDEPKDVLLSFVTWTDNTVWLNCSSIKIELANETN